LINSPNSQKRTAYLPRRSIKKKRKKGGNKIVDQLGFLKEGWGYDKVTGKPLDFRKPEESVRQKYEQILHDDYGYDYAQMDIEVYIKRGSRSEKNTKNEKAEKDRADIVIYASTDTSKRDQHQSIIGVIETKRPEQADGVKQLMSYMSASSARWGFGQTAI